MSIILYDLIWGNAQVVTVTTFTSLREASKYAGVSTQAMLLWTDRYDIGAMVDGRWHIDKEKLDRVLAGRAHIAEIEANLRQAG